MGAVLDAPDNGAVDEWDRPSLDPAVCQRLRRSFLRDASAAGGCLLVIAVGLAMVPLRGITPPPVVLVVVVLVTAVAAGLGGCVAGIVTAVAAAFVVDFAHTEPFTVLTLPTLLRSLAEILPVGVLVGLRASSVDHLHRA